MGEPPLVVDVSADGGEGTFTVWSPRPRPPAGRPTTWDYNPWVTATPNPGAGSQTVTWQAEPNDGPPRETTLLIGHVPFTFRQPGNWLVGLSQSRRSLAVQSGGEPATIKGFGFRAPVQVVFGDVPAASLVLVDENTLNVTTPAGTVGTYAPIQVIVDGQTASGSVMHFYQPPDSTPPVIVGTASGPHVGEWFTGDVQISGSITDPESLVTETNGCMTEVWSYDTAGTWFGCQGHQRRRSRARSGSWSSVIAHRPILRVRAPQGVYEPGTTITADYTCTNGMACPVRRIVWAPHRRAHHSRFPAHRG